MQSVRCAVRKTIGSCLPQENDREVFHQILQTVPPSLSVPLGLPEPNDVSMAWLCHRSYEAMTEVRPRLYRGHSYDQPTKTYPVRQGEIFEISKKGNATVFQDVARKSIVARYDDQDFLRRYPWTRLMRFWKTRRYLKPLGVAESRWATALCGPYQNFQTNGKVFPDIGWSALGTRDA